MQFTIEHVKFYNSTVKPERKKKLRSICFTIVTIDYFTKWAKAMPTLNNNGKMTALFFFNHVVARFGVP